MLTRPQLAALCLSPASLLGSSATLGRTDEFGEVSILVPPRLQVCPVVSLH